MDFKAAIPIIEGQVICLGLRQKGRFFQSFLMNRLQWDEIATKLDCEHRTCFRIRDGILMILAYEFKLLDESGKKERDLGICEIDICKQLYFCYNKIKQKYCWMRYVS